MPRSLKRCVILARSGGRCLLEHFRQRIFQPRDHELRLQINRVGEKAPQLCHWLVFWAARNSARVFHGQDNSLGARSRVGQFGAVSRNEADQFGKTFVKWTAHSFWIPDEVTDSKRSEVFAFVPGSESGNCAVAFVLPDPAPNPLGMCGGYGERGRACWRRRKEAVRSRASLTNENAPPAP